MADEKLKQQSLPAGDDAVGAVEQQEQVPGEQAQAPEGSPEFFLDEDGNIQGVFDDWGIEEPGEQVEEEEAVETEAQQQEPEEQSEQQAEPQPNYYSPEELARLELDQIDPSRLPPEVRPYYEAILKEANLEKVQQEQPDEKALYDQIQQVARQRVEQLFGEQFDELNPKHLAALAVEATKVAQQLERQMTAKQKIAELAKSEPYFAQIDQYAQEKLMELPYKEAIKIQQAMQNGDIDTLLNYWEQCRREFYEKKLGVKQEEPQQKPASKPTQPTQQPPKVETAGKGEAETPVQINPRDFAGLSEDEQAQMLIKLGLV